MSDIEEVFLFQIKAAGLPEPEREFKFLHPTRKWSFDFAWVDKKIAVEIEGGVHSGGRHVRGVGFTKDCEKYNEALRFGWQVYRFTSEMVVSGEALRFMEEVLR